MIGMVSCFVLRLRLVQLACSQPIHLSGNHLLDPDALSLVLRREKCLKEIDLVQSLHHPHIIEYLESFIEEDQLHLVFEYAEAGDLKR